MKVIANNMHNQFETPILFYVLCGIATYIAATDFVMVVLAWLYVVTRVLHTAVHVTTNRLRQRLAIFAIGVAILFAMWVLVVLRLLAA